ncbi:hypothetical protein [Brevundimonas bacteroides]|uniref:hypothetical protein n=1 Tax=Brevundimonas bacteroides TaxID=74311 RepID=UPI0004957C5C|nr:hypothetical protein [Brevundimonas bacteroides]
MTAPAFNLDDYAAGQGALRSAMVAGLSTLPPDHHAGSFTIGAFCALVRLIWDRRDPGSSRDRIASYLTTVAGDVLRDAEGRVEPPSPLQSMIEGLESAAICCAPRDDQGRVIKDRDLTLTALAAVAADLLAEEQDPAVRAQTAARHGALIADILRAAAEAPTPPRPPFRPRIVGGWQA